MIEQYYNQKFIHYLMANYTHHRTLDFIIPRRVDPKGIAYRYRRASKPDAIKFFFEKFQITTKPFNVYASVAEISKNFPIVSFKRDEALKQIAQINQDFKKYVQAYDLKLDIDNPDLKAAHAETGRIKQVLDQYEVPYWLMFSGNKGFNITIPSEYLWDTDVLSYPDLCFNFAENLKNNLKLSDLDLTVYTLGRVFKVPYSIAREKNLVALPLDNYQFENFNAEDYQPRKVLSDVKLFNRGLLQRKGTKENFNYLYNKLMPKKTVLQKIKESVTWKKNIK